MHLTCNSQVVEHHFFFQCSFVVSVYCVWGEVGGVLVCVGVCGCKWGGCVGVLFYFVLFLFCKEKYKPFTYQSTSRCTVREARIVSVKIILTIIFNLYCTQLQKTTALTSQNSFRHYCVYLGFFFPVILNYKATEWPEIGLFNWQFIEQIAWDEIYILSCCAIC